MDYLPGNLLASSTDPNLGWGKQQNFRVAPCPSRKTKQAKKCRWPLKAGKVKETDSPQEPSGKKCSLTDASAFNPVKFISNFRPLELKENKFVLFIPKYLW